MNVDNFPNLYGKLQIGKFEVFGQAITKFTFQSWPENLVLDNAAIASVLGNLLDNAITAGSKVSGSNIEVNIYMVKNNLCMKICNQTVSEHIDFTHTSSPDRLRHGIGLRSVRSSVEKMDGEFSIGERDGTVTAFVTLYNVCP